MACTHTLKGAVHHPVELRLLNDERGQFASIYFKVMRQVKTSKVSCP